MDVLADVVDSMKTGPATSGRTDVRGPWGLRFVDSHGATFHLILQGTAWLLPPDGDPIPLGPGDAVLLPRGAEHALADHPDSPLVDFDPTVEDPQQGPGARSLLLCGTYRLDRERPHPVLSRLPDVVVVPADPGRHRSLHTAISILGEELDAQRPGSAAVVPALVDALLVLILRAWFEDRDCPTEQGWARALTDPAVVRSLELIHEKPGAAWTVADLAAGVGLSRAAFARRFTDAVGEPPLTYLSRWRMTTAARLLRDHDRPLATVAKAIGYTSEFAFAKAFKRDFGVPPGTYRKQLVTA
ncbi:AraC family transcriptional regulator [Kribbella shirazensis]|uniref:AraC-like DNA-binding protein n=1 Tax=Kribbella shirazensis TaxID=1105143 RepID=A0A7X5VH88_9ACTN|nr:AraC family transcriptional regulator [Kribbella shirazensis]NIK61165.1 AraC-like DNA-binding protein [Kribbella shirazensis]